MTRGREEHQQLVRRAAQRLVDEFSGIFSKETVDRFVSESLTAFSGAKFDDFIPLFVQRFTRERLLAHAQSEGMIEKEIPEVLFVCVHNAGRSQMAAALLNRAAAGAVHVRSAGSTPANEIHANVREAMDEIGVDISEEFPKPLTDEVVKAADVVITMGCGDACPVYPGKRYLDWDIPDPADRPMREVRAIRDGLDARVRDLLGELVGQKA